MSYIAPAKNHTGTFCSKCGHYYGKPAKTSGNTCPPCESKSKD